MHSTLTFIIAIAALASAQSTAKIWIPINRINPQEVFASIISTIPGDSPATVYAIKCNAGAKPSDCELPGGLILTEGSGQAAFTNIYTDNMTSTATCRLDGGTGASCMTSFHNDISQFGTASATVTPVVFADVPLRAELVVTTPPPNPNGKTETSWFSFSGPAPTSQPTLSKSSERAATVSSTAGLAMITANAQWVVGGVAAGLALL